MLLQTSAERISDFVDLKDVEPSFLGLVGLRVQRANGNLFLCVIVVGRNFEDVSGAALDVRHHREV